MSPQMMPNTLTQRFGENVLSPGTIVAVLAGLGMAFQLGHFGEHAFRSAENGQPIMYQSDLHRMQNLDSRRISLGPCHAEAG